MITKGEDREVIKRSIGVRELDPLMCDFSIQGLTSNFIYFNKLLEEMATELNRPFFDTTSCFIDAHTGSLKQQYTESGHHYKGYIDESVTDAKQLTKECLLKFLETN